jgi:hypothetical protein
MASATRARRDRDSSPEWVQTIIKWLGIATALMGAVTTLLLAVGKFGDAVYAPCRSAPSLFCVPPVRPLS